MCEGHARTRECARGRVCVVCVCVCVCVCTHTRACVFCAVVVVLRAMYVDACNQRCPKRMLSSKVLVSTVQCSHWWCTLVNNNLYAKTTLFQHFFSRPLRGRVSNIFECTLGGCKRGDNVVDSIWFIITQCRATQSHFASCLAKSCH